MAKKHIKLDRLNRQILTQLQNNARISNNDLSELIGLSPSACLQRVKALEDSGFILEYAMVSNVDKICINVKAYAHFTLASNTYDRCGTFEKGIKKYTEVVDCMKVNGGIDYIAFMMSSTVEELNRVCDEILQDNLGIEKIVTHFVLDVPKWFGGYPLESLEWKTQEN
ncbi:Lrp/AsnC family transcriptional regulator [Pseudocolwellia sp. HL-MZ19]|uniref:Lrp/AsnC family transcriptional regulator n=1 Tax=unclassified Pseudocolwellia TaxID=2848178 RepID=UPI003CFB4EFA